MLKCGSRIVRQISLHAVQYKRQPVSVLMFYSYYFKNQSLSSYVLWDSKPDFFLSLFFFFFAKIKAFVLIKQLLQRKSEYVIYIMAKDNCFTSFSVLENPILLKPEQRENDFILYTKKYISLWTSYCTSRNRSRNLLNSNLELLMMTMSD